MIDKSTKFLRLKKECLTKHVLFIYKFNCNSSPIILGNYKSLNLSFIECIKYSSNFKFNYTS